MKKIVAVFITIIAAIWTVLVFSAQTKPNDAVENLSGWAGFINSTRLVAPLYDQMTILIGVIFLFVGVLLWWPSRSRYFFAFNAGLERYDGIDRHYIRMMISNRTNMTINSVRAWVTNVRLKSKEGGLIDVGYTEKLPLQWALYVPPKFEMTLAPKQQNEKVGVAWANDGDRLVVAYAHDALVTFSGVPGAYVFDLEVCDDVGLAIRKRICIEWSGHGPLKCEWERGWLYKKIQEIRG